MVDVQFRFRDDEAVNDPAVTVDSFSEQSNATAVRIEPGDNARALLPYLDRISLVEVSFPVWTDGRGYSSARILREAGYRGELRAVGDLVIDMLGHLQRCGFDAFAPDKTLNEADAKAAFGRWENVYQATAVDGRQAIWAKRHPA
ncbi:DUF934 domain-containing protein [Novosphingobium soli]|uniref:DUF934 domain-containing protein n=1 Tax=Novosphingobium soli TaxID=574956 RepID=A0ABV6CTR0_9SPHN